MLYACGTNRGTVALSLANPTAPTRLASIAPGSYVHDMFVQNGRAHLAELRSNIYTIIDVSNLPQIRAIGGVQYKFLTGFSPSMSLKCISALFLISS